MRANCALKNESFIQPYERMAMSTAYGGIDLLIRINVKNL